MQMLRAVPKGDVTVQNALRNAISKAEDIANCGANGELPPCHLAKNRLEGAASTVRCPT